MSVTRIAMGVFEDLHKNEFEMLAKQVVSGVRCIFKMASFERFDLIVFLVS